MFERMGMARCLAASAVLALLGGCATKPAFDPIRSGDPVALTFVMSPAAAGSIQIQNEAFGSGLASGAGGGAVAGGLWGLGCGPFIVLCVPVFAATGMIVGGAAGSVVGATGVLYGEKATRLIRRVNQQQQARPLLEDLTRNVNDRAQKYWSLTSEQPTVAVKVELQDLLLSSTRDERVHCIVRVAVLVETEPGKHEGDKDRWRYQKQKVYEYVGPYSLLAVWLDEENDLVETNLASASQQIASQIVADLALK